MKFILHTHTVCKINNKMISSMKNKNNIILCHENNSNLDN